MAIAGFGGLSGFLFSADVDWLDTKEIIMRRCIVLHLTGDLYTFSGRMFIEYTDNDDLIPRSVRTAKHGLRHVVSFQRVDAELDREGRLTGEMKPLGPMTYVGEILTREAAIWFTGRWPKLREEILRAKPGEELIFRERYRHGQAHIRPYAGGPTIPEKGPTLDLRPAHLAL